MLDVALDDCQELGSSVVAEPDEEDQMGETIQLTRGRVCYDEQGSGAPVLLIHGGAVDGRFFDQIVPERALGAGA